MADEEKKDGIPKEDAAKDPESEQNEDPYNTIPDTRILIAGSALIALGFCAIVKKCESVADNTKGKARDVLARTPDDSTGSDIRDLLTEAGDIDEDQDGRPDIASSIDEPLDPLSLAKSQFGDVPSISDTQIEDAYLAISSALEEIENNPDLKALTDGYGISLKPPAYYMAIALKESSLKKEAVSYSGRKGYFQLTTTPGSTLDDVSRFFGVDFTDEDVFYSPPADKKDYDESESLLAAKNNSIGGILYWHACRDIYLSKGFNPQISEEDKEKATAFAYNIGISDFRFLWNELKPSSFFDFGIMVSGFLTQPQMKNRERFNGAWDFDSVYRLDRVTYVQATGNQDKNEMIQIGGKSFRAVKLLQALKYAETVHSLMAFDKQYPDNFAVRPGFRMWSIADRVVDICVEDYEIPYFISADHTKTQKIETLYRILMSFNGNKGGAFVGVDPENPDVAEGTRVFVPDKAYIENYLSQTGEGGSEYVTAATNVAVEILPKKVPLYTNDPDGKLAKEGSKILEYTGLPPTVLVPNVTKIVDGKKKKVPLVTGKASLYTDKNPSGTMSHVVLHSTMGSHVGLYKNQKIHYVVLRDGTIELVRDENIPINHAGYFAQDSTKAIWNSDEDATFKSIGIEVVTGEKGGKNTLWTDKQYEAVNKLVHWIGSRHKMPAAHVLTHSQIACSKWGRGRKPDPYSVNWSKLGLPNNYNRVDPDVASGRVKSNLDWILRDIEISGSDWDGGSEGMITGLKAAVQIHDPLKSSKPPKTKSSPKVLKSPPKKDSALKAKSRDIPTVAKHGKKKR